MTIPTNATIEALVEQAEALTPEERDSEPVLKKASMKLQACRHNNFAIFVDGEFLGEVAEVGHREWETLAVDDYPIQSNAEFAIIALCNGYKARKENL